MDIKTKTIIRMIIGQFLAFIPIILINSNNINYMGYIIGFFGVYLILDSGAKIWVTEVYHIREWEDFK